MSDLSSDPRNVGHGHVFPRPDGVRMRCGGPAICRECALDLARKKTERSFPEWTSCTAELPDHNHAVLIWRPAIKTVEIAAWFMPEPTVRYWRIRHTDWELAMEMVSHWMFLPGDAT